MCSDLRTFLLGICPDKAEVFDKAMKPLVDLSAEEPALQVVSVYGTLAIIEGYLRDPLDHETRAAQTDKCPAPVSPRSKHVGTPQPAGPTNLWLWLWPLSEAVTIGRSPAGTRCSLAPEGSRAPPGLTAAPELSPLCLAG